jgi:hypothetical protein
MKLLISLILGVIVGLIAKTKNRSISNWFILTFLLGVLFNPFISLLPLLTLILLPSSYIIEENKQKCLYCGKYIDKGLNMCPYCNQPLTKTNV